MIEKNMGCKRFSLIRRAKEEMEDSRHCVVATLTLQLTGPFTILLLLLDVLDCPYLLRNLFHIAFSENKTSLPALFIAKKDVVEW